MIYSDDDAAAAVVVGTIEIDSNWNCSQRATATGRTAEFEKDQRTKIPTEDQRSNSSQTAVDYAADQTAFGFAEIGRTEIAVEHLDKGSDSRFAADFEGLVLQMQPYQQCLKYQQVRFHCPKDLVEQMKHSNLVPAAAGGNHLETIVGKIAAASSLC